MPMGIKQQNDMFRATIDVWEDKIFLNEKEYPAGHFSAEILNVSNEFIVASAGKAQDLLTILPGVSYADKYTLKTMLPMLKRFLIGIITDLSAIEPFSLWDIEGELLVPEVMLSEETLNDLINPGRGRDFFIQYLSAAIAAPFAVYHFMEPARVLVDNFLSYLDKRTETYFTMGVHDAFNHPKFKELIADAYIPNVEPFTYSPNMRSSYCFARDPKHYGEMIFVNRLFFDSYMDFFVYDLLNGMHHGHAPSKCQNCGRYFLTTDARTRTIRKHHQRGKISDEERQEAMKVCEELRDQALLDNEFAQSEYLQLMEQDAIYAEVERRLGGGTHDK